MLNVYVQGSQIERGTQLDFSDWDGALQLAPGDQIAIEYPDNRRAKGTVRSVGTDNATVQIDDAIWIIRPATSKDVLAPIAKGPPTKSWVVTDAAP